MTEIKRDNETQLDVALVVLRMGLAAACLFAGAESRWLRAGLWLCAALVACGVLTRLAAVAAAAGWGAALIATLLPGPDWFLFRVLATMYVIAFTALALTGPRR
jgi:hypothetical protein